MQRKTKKICVFCIISALSLGIIVGIVYQYYFAPKPAPLAFQGRYEQSSGYLEIRNLGEDKLSLKGYSEWYNESGAIHFGEIDGEAILSGTLAKYSRAADGCEMTIEFFPTKIKVADNKKCGGMNVTFDGIYPQVR